MAAPALFREGSADKNKEGGDGFSKTKMLITLKTEVANVRAQIQEEQTKREHMQDWIKDTLKPTLVEMKKEYSDALRDLNSCVPDCLLACLCCSSSSSWTSRSAHALYSEIVRNDGGSRCFARASTPDDGVD